jgi:hypothetical protein
MYGSIPEEYPETRRFALQQWAWLEAVERKAQMERPLKVEPTAPEPEDDILPLDDSLWDHAVPISDEEPEVEELASKEESGQAEGMLDSADDFMRDDAAAVPLTQLISPIEEEQEAVPETDPYQSEELISGDAAVEEEKAELLMVTEESPAEEPDEGDFAPADIPLREIESIEEPDEEDVSQPDIPVQVDESAEEMDEDDPSQADVPLWEDESTEEPEISVDELLERTPINLKTISEDPPSESEGYSELDSKPPFIESAIPSLDISSPSVEDEVLDEHQDLEEPAVPSHDAEQITDQMDVPSEELEQPTAEPEQGRRFRVVLRSPDATIPFGLCAHCLRTPASQQLVIVGSGDDVEKPRTYTLPLCKVCHRRARARSDDEKNARLTAYLGSGLAAAAVIVASLASGLVNFRTNPLIDVIILSILGILGFAIPAWFLLGRIGRYAPPRDAIFVRSTLAIPERSEDVQTAFEWRNKGYAKRFMEANYQALIGELFEVQDWLDLRPSSEEQQS